GAHALPGDAMSAGSETGTVTTSADRSAPPVLETSALRKQYVIGGSSLRRSSRQVKAIDGVDITVHAGETLGLVGESGSGKSSLARVVMRLIDATSGTIRLRGKDVTAAHGSSLRVVR